MRTLLVLLWLFCAGVANAAFGPAWLAATQRTAAAPSGDLTLAEIPQAKVWLAADKMAATADGAGVALWTNATGIGDATQTTSGSRPLYSNTVVNLNSKPALHFDGSDDWMVLTNMQVPAFASNFMVYIVTETLVEHGSDTGGSAQLLLSGDSELTVYQVWYNDAVGHRSAAGSAIDVADATLGSQLLTWELNGESANQTKVYRNGTQIGVGTTFTKVLFGLGPAIGARYSGFGPFSGRIAEIIVASTLHTTGERENIENKLGTKYGLTITH